MVAPNRPRSRRPATRSSGYSSACSRSDATGMTSLSTNLRTVATSSSARAGSVRLLEVGGVTPAMLSPPPPLSHSCGPPGRQDCAKAGWGLVVAEGLDELALVHLRAAFD